MAQWKQKVTWKDCLASIGTIILGLILACLIVAGMIWDKVRFIYFIQ
jgi:hypothetical protein